MEKLFLRRAEPEDMMPLYRWINEPSVRANSFRSEIISLEEHQRWFQKALDDPNVSIFIMMLDAQPIGQVRLTLDDNIQLIDYSIDVEHRKHGFGTLILSMVEQHCDQTLPLVGKVRLTNVASQKVFEKLGYERTEAPDHFIYTKILSTQRR